MVTFLARQTRKALANAVDVVTFPVWNTVHQQRLHKYWNSLATGIIGNSAETIFWLHVVEDSVSCWFLSILYRVTRLLQCRNDSIENNDLVFVLPVTTYLSSTKLGSINSAQRVCSYQQPRGIDVCLSEFIKRSLEHHRNGVAYAPRFGTTRVFAFREILPFSINDTLLRPSVGSRRFHSRHLRRISSSDGVPCPFIHRIGLRWPLDWDYRLRCGECTTLLRRGVHCSQGRFTSVNLKR